MSVATNEAMGNNLTVIVVKIWLDTANHNLRITQLRNLEAVATWLLLTRPRKGHRHKFFSSLLKAKDCELCQNKKAELRYILREAECEHTDKIARAIIERVNAAVLHNQEGTRTHMMNQWVFSTSLMSDGKDVQKHTLGGFLALLNRNAGSCWKHQIDRLLESGFPLSVNFANEWDGVCDPSDLLEANKQKVFATLDSQWQMHRGLTPLENNIQAA